MSGKLEPTNSPYAMAKLASIEIADSMTKEFGHEIFNLMPTNLYGPNDNFSSDRSHVIPGLIHRMHKAKIEEMPDFKIWGTGTPLREFLYVDDFADAVEYLLDKKPKESLLNVGSGEEISIADLSNLVKETIGYKGVLKFDESKPDGNPRKLIDSRKLASLGWEASTQLSEGLNKTYDWYKKNI